jgi:hypothetical protein
MNGRTKSPFIKMVTTTTLNDDKSWRKYGQKNIHSSSNPRYTYCICTCAAVQFIGALLMFMSVLMC